MGFGFFAPGTQAGRRSGLGSRLAWVYGPDLPGSMNHPEDVISELTRLAQLAAC